MTQLVFVLDEVQILAHDLYTRPPLSSGLLEVIAYKPAGDMICQIVKSNPMDERWTERTNYRTNPIGPSLPW